MKKILIFNGGKCLGEVSIIDRPNEPALIEILKVELVSGEIVDVLHIIEMEYAILLQPKHAEEMYKLLDKKRRIPNENM